MPHCVSAASEDTLGATGKFSSLTRSHPGMTHLLRVVMLAVCNNLPWIFMEKHRLEFVPSVRVRVCVCLHQLHFCLRDSIQFISGKLNDSLDSLNVQNPIISTIYHIYTNIIMSRQHMNVILKKHQLSP